MAKSFTKIAVTVVAATAVLSTSSCGISQQRNETASTAASSQTTEQSRPNISIYGKMMTSVTIAPLSVMVYTCEALKTIKPSSLGMKSTEPLVAEGKYILVSLTLWNDGNYTFKWSGEEARLAVVHDDVKNPSESDMTFLNINAEFEKILRPEPALLNPKEAYKTYVVYDIPDDMHVVGLVVSENNDKTAFIRMREYIG